MDSSPGEQAHAAGSPNTTGQDYMEYWTGLEGRFRRWFLYGQANALRLRVMMACMHNLYPPHAYIWFLYGQANALRVRVMMACMHNLYPPMHISGFCTDKPTQLVLMIYLDRTIMRWNDRHDGP